MRREALSDSNGMIDFFVSEDGCGSLFKHRVLSGKAVTVPVKRFDSLSLASPDLLFIDAQSSELRILKGFGELLSQVKYVIVETGFYSEYLNNGENFDQVNKLLRDKGFTFVATYVSGRGKFRFWVMRTRGVIYNIRKHGIKGFSSYSGFFDVLYRNNRLP